MNHFARFEKKMSREPEIRRALEGMTGSDLSANLQELSRRGTARLDDTTLLERARLMSAIYSRLSDRACASIARGSLTENGGAEFELTLLQLEVGFVSRWMECLHKAMLAEARQTPVHTVTRGERGRQRLQSRRLHAAYGCVRGDLTPQLGTTGYRSPA